MKDPNQRKVGKRGQNKAACEIQFNRADMLLQEVCSDIVNGVSRNDIICKFALKKYEYQKKAIKHAQACEYLRMANLVLADNRVEQQEQLRDQLYNQYLMLYNDAVMSNNTLVAKQILDSMAKTFLPQQQKEVELNINKDSLAIKFGFSETETNEG